MVVEKEGTFEVEGKTLYTKSWLVCRPGSDHMLHPAPDEPPLTHHHHHRPAR